MSERLLLQLPGTFIVLFADERPWKLRILISCFGLSCFMYRGLAGKSASPLEKGACQWQTWHFDVAYKLTVQSHIVSKPRACWQHDVASVHQSNA